MATQVLLQRLRTGLLPRVLRTDGVVCMIAGTLAVTLAAVIAPTLGLPQSIEIRLLGIVMVVYGLILFSSAQHPQRARRIAIASLVMDLLWVTGSAWLLSGHVLPLTTTGWWLVLGMAVVVVGFAEATLWGLWRGR